jgi:large subunit ribosomal protein L22
MATSTARLENLRVSARKVRLVADTVRGKRVDEARSILRFTVKRCAEPLRKLLDSAVANAENAAAERNERIDSDAMLVSRIIVDEGRTINRYISAPRGRATRIRKRSSHVFIELTGDAAATPRRRTGAAAQ